MAALSALFPSMRGVPGTDPWDPVELIEWCNGPAPTSGSRWAARFLLAVWDGYADWADPQAVEPCLASDGRFEIVKAWSIWDNPHRQAALAWLTNPFWP